MMKLLWKSSPIYKKKTLSKNSRNPCGIQSNVLEGILKIWYPSKIFALLSIKLFELKSYGGNIKFLISSSKIEINNILKYIIIFFSKKNIKTNI